MSTAVAQPRLRVAFAEAFALRLEQPVRAHLSMPCDVILGDEIGIVSRLSDTDGMLAARAKHIAENIHRTARREPPMHLIPAAAE
jgi:hypothetical protein